MGTTSESCILLGGYAQPPKETAANFTYNILSCQILVNKKISLCGAVSFQYNK